MTYKIFLEKSCRHCLIFSLASLSYAMLAGYSAQAIGPTDFTKSESDQDSYVDSFIEELLSSETIQPQPFDITENALDLLPFLVSDWSSENLQCFFKYFGDSSFLIRDEGIDFHLYSTNIISVQNLLSENDITVLNGVYCDELIYLVSNNVEPLFWISLVPVSRGGSTTMMFFWEVDPRSIEDNDNSHI